MKKILLILFIFTLIGCSNNQKQSKKLVFKEDMIQIIIDSVEELNLGENSEITFKLWGYDTRIADAKATLLNEYTYKLSKLPVTYGLDYNKEWNEKIAPSESENFGYYITLEIDGKNEKEYKVDYDATDKDYFGTRKKNIKDVSGRIYIKEAK